MHFLAEIKDIKSAKETKCLRIILVTNEMSAKEAGELLTLKDGTVEVELKEISQSNEF